MLEKVCFVVEKSPFLVDLLYIGYACACKEARLVDEGKIEKVCVFMKKV